MSPKGFSPLFNEGWGRLHGEAAKPLPETFSRIGAGGGKGQEVRIHGNEVSRFSRDGQFDKHRVPRVTFQFKLHAYRSIFVADVSETVERELDSPRCEIRKSGGDCGMKQDGSIFGKHWRTHQRNRLAGLQRINDFLGG